MGFGWGKQRNNVRTIPGLIIDFVSVRSVLIIEFASVREGLIIGFPPTWATIKLTWVATAPNPHFLMASLYMVQLKFTVIQILSQFGINCGIYGKLHHQVNLRALTLVLDQEHILAEQAVQ